MVGDPVTSLWSSATSRAELLAKPPEVPAHVRFCCKGDLGGCCGARSIERAWEINDVACALVCLVQSKEEGSR